MIRVVLDTNLIISALLTPRGLPAQAVAHCFANPDIELCISADIYAEYEEVLHRPKFRRSDQEIAAFLRAIRRNGKWIKPLKTLHVCPDPDDDIFLECAEGAGANYLVTGNTKDFPAHWAATEVLTARDFLSAIE